MITFTATAICVCQVYYSMRVSTVYACFSVCACVYKYVYFLAIMRSCECVCMFVCVCECMTE